jgi:tol-pal system protein YbgF
MVALALTSLLAAGCSTVSSEEFAALQGTVAREQARQRELTKRVETLGRSVEGSRGPQANLVADMDYLRQEISRLQGRIEEESARRGGGDEQADLERRLARVESFLGLAAGGEPPAGARPPAAAPAPAPVADLDDDRPPKPGKAPAPAAAEPAPQSADALFALGQRLHKQKSFQASRDRLEDFLKRYPKDKRSDEAQFMVGDGLYAEKKYEEAILAFNQLVKRFPDSSYAPGALLKEGMSFSELGDKRTAKIVLGKLVKSYPKSAEAKQAEKLMAKMP